MTGLCHVFYGEAELCFVVDAVARSRASATVSKVTNDGRWSLGPLSSSSSSMSASARAPTACGPIRTDVRAQRTAQPAPPEPAPGANALH